MNFDDDERPQDGPAKAEVRAESEWALPGGVTATLTVGTLVDVEVSTPHAPLTKTVTEWAQEKGHIPDPNKPIRFAGDIHRGPHVAVVRQHKRWPSNKVVTEAEYDAAVKDAYSIPVGENLADKRSGQ